MRFLVWACRIVLTIAIAAFVATVFYQTHSVTVSETTKAVLNWVSVVGTALVGLTWPLMRRYWQALLLLISLGVARALFGTDPGFSSIGTPLLTPFQSDFLWVSIGVTALSLIGSILVRAIVSDRHMRAMKQQTSTVVTGEDVAAATATALQEPNALAEPEPQAAASEATEVVAPPADAETPDAQKPEESVQEPPEQATEPAATDEEK